MPVAVRLLTSGLAAAVCQWGLAVASLLAMSLEPTTWWLGLSGVLTAVVSVVTYRLIVRPGPDAGDDGAGGSPDPPPEDDPPPWWPDFEREFREHLERPVERV